MGIKILKKSATPAATVIPFSAVSASEPNGQSSTPDWISGCQSEKGKPINNLANAMTALRDDPALSSAIRLNEMSELVMLVKSATAFNEKPGDFKPRPIRDDDITALQEHLQRAGLTRIGKDIVHQAVDRRARELSYHPVREYLKGLNWDGTKRVCNWLSSYLGASPTSYTEAIGRMFLVSAVARIFHPGCKADYMLVLEGPQGARKSTACRILGGDWFSDNLPDVTTGGKDVSQHLRGKWLIEIAEMSAMTKGESAHLKAFVTRNVERYRPSYGRKEIVQPRQCVFIGTTNLSVYLKDDTGGRRFWPVPVGSIDTEALAQDRDQLFAEAVELYHNGTPWHPDHEFERTVIHPEQEARFEQDPWEEPIREHVKTSEKKRVRVGQILSTVLNMELERRSTRNERRVSAILGRLGWRRDPKKDADGNIWWVLPE